MSDGSPQPAPEREHAGCSMGIGLGLLLLLGLVSTMVAQKTRVADGEQLFKELFVEQPLPFGLEVAGATVEMRGEQVILLTRSDASEEAQKAERPEPKKNEGGDEQDREDDEEEEETVDWSKIPSGPEGTLPLEALVIAYPSQLASSELSALFGFSSEDDDEIEITDIDAGGGRVMMDRGRLDWGEYSTMYVHERELEWGGTFRDVVRVNLSLSGEARVLFVRWPRGFPASLERVSELVDALTPVVAVVVPEDALPED